MAEHRGDGLQGHAAVDGLGGQGVAQLVGVDVPLTCRGPGLVDEPGHGVPVQGLAVLVGDEQLVAGGDVRGPVGADELDEVGVQGQVAVLVQLADRDVQPVRIADEHDLNKAGPVRIALALLYARRLCYAGSTTGRQYNERQGSFSIYLAGR